jgi:nucleotide-binding universal stress UspA family protein
MSEAVHEATEELAKAGLIATHQVLAGVPSEVLLAEAENWRADCIFVGSSSMTRLGRVLQGDVCATVGSRAVCSVEIVR